jgi:hypothetical protein
MWRRPLLLLALLSSTLVVGAVVYRATRTSDDAYAQGLTITWYVSPQGSDTNDGRSTSSGFQTLAKAYAVAQPGQVIGVLGGNYPKQSLSLDNSKAGTARVVIAALNPVKVAALELLSVKHLRVQGPFEVNVLFADDGAGGPLSDVELDGLHIHTAALQGVQDFKLLNSEMGPNAFTAAPGYQDDILYVGTRMSSNVLIEGNRFHDATHPKSSSHTDCIQFTMGTDVTIRRNTFRRCYDQSLIIKGDQGALTHFTLENNFIDKPVASTSNFGLQIAGNTPCTRCKVINNSFLGTPRVDAPTAAGQQQSAPSNPGGGGSNPPPNPPPKPPPTTPKPPPNPPPTSPPPTNPPPTTPPPTTPPPTTPPPTIPIPPLPLGGGRSASARAAAAAPQSIFAGNIVENGGTGTCTKSLANGWVWDHNVFERSPCGSNAYSVRDHDVGYADRANFDLHLTNGSEALDRGNPDMFSSNDVDAEGRPAGPGPDAGADERDMGVPTLRFAISQYQRALKTGNVVIPLTCAAACQLKASGRVSLIRAAAHAGRARLSLGSDSKQLASGASGTLVLTLPPATAKAVRKQLAAGRRASAVVTIAALGNTGSSGSTDRSVELATVPAPRLGKVTLTRRGGARFARARVICSEACTIRSSGVIAVRTPGRRRVTRVRFAGRSMKAVAGKPVIVRLRFSRGGVAAVRRALARGSRVSFVMAVRSATATETSVLARRGARLRR